MLNNGVSSPWQRGAILLNRFLFSSYNLFSDFYVFESIVQGLEEIFSPQIPKDVGGEVMRVPPAPGIFCFHLLFCRLLCGFY